MANKINYFPDKPDGAQPAPIVESGPPQIIYDSPVSQYPWKLVLAMLFLCFSLIGFGYYYFQIKEYSVTSYAQCVAAGNQVQESYPSVCVTKGGRRFQEPLPSILPAASVLPLDSPSPTIATESSITYDCPSSGWVDCMPSPDGAKSNNCSPEALDWLRTHCPDFQGAAY